MNMNKHYKQPFPIFLKADNVYKYFNEFSGRSFNILFYNKHLYLYLKKKLFEGATIELHLSNQFF